MTKRVAVVTGATGCLGRAVAMSLLADKRSTWEVYGRTRKGSVKSLPHNVRPITGALPYVDAVFHCAGNTSHNGTHKKDQWEDNVAYTANVVKWMTDSHPDAKLIFTSTGASYLFYQSGDTSNYYAFTKAIAECIVASKPNAVIIQPCVILGPGDTRNYSKLFGMAARGKLGWAIPGSIEFGYVHDVANAHVNAYYTGKAGHAYMVGGVRASWRDFFQEIHSVQHLTTKVRTLPLSLARLSCRIASARQFFTGKLPVISLSTLNLLARDASVPAKEAVKSSFEIGYTPQTTLREMVWMQWQSIKHETPK